MLDGHTFLGLLAKIKCSICSLEFDNSNGGHCVVLALLGWQLGHGTALQPWPSTLSINPCTGYSLKMCCTLSCITSQVISSFESKSNVLVMMMFQPVVKFPVISSKMYSQKHTCSVHKSVACLLSSTIYTLDGDASATVEDGLAQNTRYTTHHSKLQSELKGVLPPIAGCQGSTP